MLSEAIVDDSTRHTGTMASRHLHFTIDFQIGKCDRLDRAHRSEVLLVGAPVIQILPMLPEAVIIIINQASLACTSTCI